MGDFDPPLTVFCDFDMNFASMQGSLSLRLDEDTNTAGMIIQHASSLHVFVRSDVPVGCKLSEIRHYWKCMHTTQCFGVMAD